MMNFETIDEIKEIKESVSSIRENNFQLFG